MKISKENLLYYNFIDCKIKNLLIDKKYNSELNNYLIDKELSELMSFKNKLDSILPNLSKKELNLFSIFTGEYTNRDVAKIYNVTEQTICLWKNDLLKKINQ